MKSRNLRLNILGIISFCLILIGYFFFKEFQKTEPERKKQKNLYAHFLGKIDHVYRDYANHGVTILILKTRKR
jgi:hypothetical protein